jgi:hypothetical protein
MAVRPAIFNTTFWPSINDILAFDKAFIFEAEAHRGPTIHSTFPTHGPPCARTLIGHVAAALPRSVMDSRRLMFAPYFGGIETAQIAILKGFCDVRYGSCVDGALARTF